MLLTKAAIYCAQHRIERIALGPLAGNPFPDATPQFFAAMEGALSLGLAHRIEVAAPFASMDKSEVIRLGVELGVPLELTLSCMNPREGRHCGQCSKCRERRDAFADAGVDDPTDLRGRAASVDLLAVDKGADDAVFAIEDCQIGDGSLGDRAETGQVQLARGGRRAHLRRVDERLAKPVHDRAKRAVHRQRTAGQRAVVEDDGLVADADAAAAQPRERAGWQPGTAGAVGDRHDPVGALGGDRNAAHARVHVVAVAYELRARRPPERARRRRARAGDARSASCG